MGFQLKKNSLISAENLQNKIDSVNTLIKNRKRSREKYLQILDITKNIRNSSPTHATLLYYRGKALHKLGLHKQAKLILTRALRKKKKYPQKLLLDIRYERAQVYEKLGYDKKAQIEYERIYMQEPHYKSVMKKLGLE